MVQSFCGFTIKDFVFSPSNGSFAGVAPYNTGSKPQAAPLRGNVGCVNAAALALRPTATAGGGGTIIPVNIYGPMEAGFTSSQPGMSCLGNFVLPGGVDTQTAEAVMANVCSVTDLGLLDYCGGHANPYHYHQSMSCLYTPDSVTEHSTRIGTAGDGNGIYGAFVDGGLVPTDLDACGGRYGITPDSNGQRVYYYVMQESAPFTLACFGPGTVEQCRTLYPGCSASSTTLTTAFGSGSYKLDCPCFDSDRSNVAGQGL